MTTTSKMARRAAAGALALGTCLVGGVIGADAARASEPSHGPVPAVVVVCGDCLVDAATAAPLAAVLGAPVVLVERGGLSTATDDLLRSLHASEAIVVGGPTAVPDALAEQVRRTTVEGAVERLGGADRYATSRQVAALVADLVAAT